MTCRTHTHLRGLRMKVLAPTLTVVALGTFQFFPTTAVARGGNRCSKTAELLQRACRHQSIADLWVAHAKCRNLADLDEKSECQSEAREEFHEVLDLCGEQNDVRLDICEDLGESAYDPEIDPANFVDVIDNPYLPYIPGTHWVYEGETEDGLEVIEIDVLHETKEILGVTCTIVRDVVSIDGEVVEDTFDWYAQDIFGNVWYFGELSMEFEDGELVSLEGSWKSGVDGAKPGIVMKGTPEVGQVYRQEFLAAEAEDMGAVLALDATVDVPFGMFENCVQTADYLPIEPDALEHKFYAAGVGFVLEVKPEDGERVELIEMTTP